MVPDVFGIVLREILGPCAGGVAPEIWYVGLLD